MTFRHGAIHGMGFSARRWFVDSARGGLGLLAVFPVCWGLAALGQWLPEDLRQTHVILLFLRSSQSAAGWKLLAVASAVLVAPVVEEVLYRGIVQSALLGALRRRWPAILITSALFASIHLGLQRDPTRVSGLENLLPLFALAVVLGYNYERSGRLWSSILIHMLFNGVNVAVVLWP